MLHHKRTHTCGEINKELVDQTVILNGWVDRVRDHGGVKFIDLRDRYGISQVVIREDASNSVKEVANEISIEFVIAVSGKIVKRQADTINEDIATGEVELVAAEIIILNNANGLPFNVHEKRLNEDLRLQFRYLDLRREQMQRNLVFRHKIVQYIRGFLNTREFLEIETPILTRSTPEGARDYLVPSRIHSGTFYALPQSPQQLKQLLMIGGLDRYYQIARCFRDEDLRSDRQPEFTQLDIEMAFVNEEEIIEVISLLISEIIGLTPNMKLQSETIPRLKYADAINLYGTDRPDLRYGMQLYNVTELVASSEFKVFSSAVDRGMSYLHYVQKVMQAYLNAD